jgi:hypothetical protein
MRPTVGKFCTPEKPASRTCSQEDRHEAERVGAVDAREHGRVSTTGRTSLAISMTIALASP